MNTWPIRCRICGAGLGLVELPDDAPDAQIEQATTGYECGTHTEPLTEGADNETTHGNDHPRKPEHGR